MDLGKEGFDSFYLDTPANGINWIDSQLNDAGGINDQILDARTDLVIHGDNLKTAGLSSYGAQIEQVLAGSVSTGKALSSFDSAIKANSFAAKPRDYSTIKRSIGASESSINSILTTQFPGFEQQLHDTGYATEANQLADLRTGFWSGTPIFRFTDRIIGLQGQFSALDAGLPSRYDTLAEVNSAISAQKSYINNDFDIAAINSALTDGGHSTITLRLNSRSQVNSTLSALATADSRLDSHQTVTLNHLGATQSTDMVALDKNLVTQKSNLTGSINQQNLILQDINTYGASHFKGFGCPQNRRVNSRSELGRRLSDHHGSAAYRQRFTDIYRGQ